MALNNINIPQPAGIDTPERKGEVKKDAKPTVEHKDAAADFFAKQLGALKNMGANIGKVVIEAAQNQPATQLTGKEILQIATIEEHGKAIEVARKHLAEATAELKVQQERLQKILAIDIHTNMAEAVKLNASWFVDSQDMISQSIHIAHLRNEKLNATQDRIKALEDTAKKTLGEMYVHTYLAAKKEGRLSSQILFAAFDQLGGELPAQLKSPFATARDEALKSGTLSAFDRVYFAGDYSAALNILKDENKANSALSGLAPHEVSQGYEESLTFRKEQSKNISYRIKDTSPAAARLKEGYICIAMPSDTPENAYGTLTMVKKLPDGNLSVVQFSQDGHGKNVPRTISPRIIEDSHVGEQSIEGNFDRLVGKMPSFKVLGNAAQTLQHEFSPIQNLLQAGEDGKMPPDFVDTMKGMARKIDSSNALSMVRANMGNAKRDIDLLKQLPVGERGPFEKKIAELETSYAKIVKIVDDHVIEDFCDKILNPAFTADTAWSWFVKEGISLVSSALVGFALAFITFSTGGAGGFAIAGVVGAVGARVGREIGSIVAEGVGETSYGEGYSQKTKLGQYIADEKYYDSKTNSFKVVDGDEVLNSYGKEFVQDFSLAFGMAGLSKMALPFLSKCAAEYGTNPGLRASMARVAGRALDLYSKDTFTVNKEKVIQSFLQRLGNKLASKFQKKANSEAMEQLDGHLLAVIEQQSLTGGKEFKNAFAKYQLIDKGLAVEGDKLVQVFAINATLGEFEALKKSVGDMFAQKNFVQTIVGNGLDFTKTIASGDGASVGVRFVPHG